ncbi:MAG TPA: ABC transporter permease subunit [Ktedonobacteraceae bacterium]|nr:ABC transporter permease subunit [Ktedonobacteraceae bacterium]
MRKSNVIAMLVALIPIVFIAIFVGIPILMAIAFSLGYTGGPNTTVALLDQNLQVTQSGPIFSVYSHLISDLSFQKDFWSTIWVTALSVVLVLLIGWGLALYMRFTRGWLVNIVSSLYIVPLFIPVVIASYALVTFWNTNGFMSALIENVLHLHFAGIGYTSFGVVVGQVWTNIPFAVLMLASGLQAVPDPLIEAARDTGASQLTILRRIIVPLNTLPTMIVGTFTGIGVLGSFTVPDLMGPTAPTMLGVSMSRYYQSFNEPQLSTAVAVIVFLLAAGLGALYVWANIRSNRKAGATQ